MQCIRTALILAATTAATVEMSFGQWSILEEVTVLDPFLSAEMVWEDDFATICTAFPQNLSNLDFFTCNELSDTELVQWVGFDASGDRYGVTRQQVLGGEDYTIRRRRRGTRTDDVVVRVLRYRDNSVRLKSVSVGKTWSIDPVQGEMVLDVTGFCEASLCGVHTWRAGAIRISGLPTLFEIILSYEPPAGLSFNVPVHPEGLPGSDSFSLYSGSVSTASDLSQAMTIQCSVPTGRPPVPGEHLLVPDPLPDPAPGEGRYYVAAARHGALVRAGRSSIGGVLQGRNAAALPGCR